MLAGVIDSTCFILSSISLGLSYAYSAILYRDRLRRIYGLIVMLVADITHLR